MAKITLGGNMKKRQFLIPLAVLATSMAADTALANAADSTFASNLKELATANLLASDNVNNPKTQSDFVLNRSIRNTMVAEHTSHSSHYSHESHASHSSHFSGS